MKNFRSTFVVASLLAVCGATSAFARDIDCSIPKGEKTVNGIRSVKFHKDDWQGVGSISITRDAGGIASGPASMDSELSWNEGASLDPAGNYSVDDSVSIQKSRDASGVSKYALVKVRRTLSGPHCDGWHACEVRLEIVENVAVACSDSFDLIKSGGGYHCDPSFPGDCE